MGHIDSACNGRDRSLQKGRCVLWIVYSVAAVLVHEVQVVVGPQLIFGPSRSVRIETAAGVNVRQDRQQLLKLVQQVFDLLRF